MFPCIFIVLGVIYFICIALRAKSKVLMWMWNNNIIEPTFTPSLLVNTTDPASFCHLFLTDGKIQFLGDCFHDLKNQTVDMVDISEPEIWIE